MELREFGAEVFPEEMDRLFTDTRSDVKHFISEQKLRKSTNLVAEDSGQELEVEEMTEFTSIKSSRGFGHFSVMRSK